MDFEKYVNRTGDLRALFGKISDPNSNEDIPQISPQPFSHRMVQIFDFTSPLVVQHYARFLGIKVIPGGIRFAITSDEDFDLILAQLQDLVQALRHYNDNIKGKRSE